MSRRKTTITAAIALLLMAGTAIAQPGSMGMGNRDMNQAQDGPGHMEGGILSRILPMLHHLDLTSDQADQIRDIVDDARSDIEALREVEEGTGFRDQFRDMFTSPALSQAEVEAHLNARLESMKDSNSIIAEALVEIHDVLTDEQLEMIADFEPSEIHERVGSRSPSAHGGHH